MTSNPPPVQRVECSPQAAPAKSGCAAASGVGGFCAMCGFGSFISCLSRGAVSSFEHTWFSSTHKRLKEKLRVLFGQRRGRDGQGLNPFCPPGHSGRRRDAHVSNNNHAASSRFISWSEIQGINQNAWKAP